MPLGTEARGQITYNFSAVNDSWGDPLETSVPRFQCTISDVYLDEAAADAIAQEVMDGLSSVFDHVTAYKSVVAGAELTPTS
jgi:hypothetical protein